MTSGPGARLFGYPSLPVKHIPIPLPVLSSQNSVVSNDMKEGDEDAGDEDGDDENEDDEPFNYEEEPSGRPVRKPREEEKIEKKEREKKRFPMWTS